MWLASVLACLIVLALALWTAPLWLVPRLAARSRAACSPSRPQSESSHSRSTTAPMPCTRVRFSACCARTTHGRRSSHLQPRAWQRSARRGDGGRGSRARQPSDARRASVRLAPAAFAAAVREADTVLEAVRSGALAAAGVGVVQRRHARYDRARGPSLRARLDLSVRRASAVGCVSAAYILANARPGAVVVLHEGGERGRRTVEVLRRVLPELRARGYRIVTLSELAALRR